MPEQNRLLNACATPKKKQKKRRKQNGYCPTHNYYIIDLCVREKSNIAGGGGTMWAGRDPNFTGRYSCGEEKNFQQDCRKPSSKEVDKNNWTRARKGHLQQRGTISPRTTRAEREISGILCTRELSTTTAFTSEGYRVPRRAKPMSPPPKRRHRKSLGGFCIQQCPILSTCPLHTNSGCGKERRILIGPW